MPLAPTCIYFVPFATLFHEKHKLYFIQAQTFFQDTNDLTKTNLFRLLCHRWKQIQLEFLLETLETRRFLLEKHSFICFSTLEFTGNFVQTTTRLRLHVRKVTPAAPSRSLSIYIRFSLHFYHIVRIIAGDARTRSRVQRLAELGRSVDRWKTQTWYSTIAFTFRVQFSFRYSSLRSFIGTTQHVSLSRVSIQCWVSHDWVEKCFSSAVNCLRAVFSSKVTWFRRKFGENFAASAVDELKISQIMSC